MLTYINEESFFACVKWLHPALSGILVSVQLGDHFFTSIESHTIFVWQSCCYKLPMLWEESTWSISYNVTSLIGYSFAVITLFTHIALFMRQRKLEKQRVDQRGLMIVSYNRDGVTISRSTPDQSSGQKLWRHNRTVVSPNASLLIFLIRIPLLIPHALQYFTGEGISGPAGPSIFGQFIIFSLFCKHFFLCSFIETIFSPTLRDTLIDFFPCWRHDYHVINV